MSISRSRWRGRRRMVLVVCALVASLLAHGPTGAAPGDQHTISGTVTDGTDPLGDMTVSLWCQGCAGGTSSDPSDPLRPWPSFGVQAVDFLLIAETTTAADGSYTLSYTEPVEGRPVMRVWDPVADAGLMGPDYAFSAPPATPGQWGSASGVDAIMFASEGPLSGFIRAGSNPAPDGQYAIRAGFGFGIDVAADGSYATPFLPEGSVSLSYAVSRPYVSSLGTLLTTRDISTPPVFTVDHVIERAASLSGRVTSEATGLPLEGIRVVGSGDSPDGLFTPETTEIAGQTGNIFTVKTDANGEYAVPEIVPGNWRVTFTDPAGNYGSESYDDTPPSLDQPIAVGAASAVTGIDAALGDAGSVQGTVIGPFGDPVASADVSVCPASANARCVFTETASDGSYVVSGLRAGDVTVEVQAGEVFAVFGGTTPAVVAVAPGAVATADFRLDGTRIAGEVVDAGGDPVAGVEVSIRNVVTGFQVATATTAIDGSYVSGVVTAGDYSVVFGSFELWDDIPWSPLAGLGTSVPASAGVLVGGINAEIDASYIQGTVTAAGGPVGDVGVSAFASSGASAHTTTRSDGTYRLAVPPGDYTVQFDSPYHLFEVYDDATFQQPTTVSVAGSSVRNGIDADLAPLPAPTAPPAGTMVVAGGTLSGVPALGPGDQLEISHTGCPGGTVTATVIDSYGSGFQEPLNETAVGSGVFDASIDVVGSGLGSLVTVRIAEVCPDPADDETTEFNIYIDPAGTIVDQRGNPIEGATVTLMRDNPDTVVVDFEAVPDGSVVMDPSINTKNPDVTEADGMFRWDVVAGLWKVRATAPGCHAPGDPGTPFAETAELVVPPPRLGLVIELECEPVCPNDGVLDPFTDVADTSFALADITCIFDLGVTTGTSPTTYSPSGEVTREQMASFLARMYRAITGEQAPVVATPFTDVPATSFAVDDVARIFGLGITTGTSATTYSPADNVTREQMASFLARLYRAAY